MTIMTPAPAHVEEALAGPKILIEGPAGTGKTHTLGTLVDWAAAQSPPMEVFVLFTENGLESLKGYWADYGREIPSNLHWHTVRTPALGLASLIDAAKKVGQLSYKSLTDMQDPNRSANNPWERFLTTLTDFPDDRTGKRYGNVGEWKADRILVNDSLSETATACFKMIVGNKPTASQPDYLIAQNNLLNWLRWMTQSLQCTFVLTAHVQRQINEILGTTQLMTKAIGKAIGDEIPQLFSDVIYTVREGATWYWDTAATGVDLKTRNLPIAGKQKPDFGPLMSKWKARSQA
jgi:hypothetical protein